MEMKIEQSFALKDVEVSNLEIRTHSHELLLLPRKFDNKDFFIVASLIQSISSWLRKNLTGKLVVPFTTLELEQRGETLGEFMNDEVIYTSLLMAWPRVIDSQGLSATKHLRHYTSKTALALNGPVDNSWRPLKGHAVILPCFDHFSADGGLLNSFYHGGSIYVDDAFDLSPFSSRLSKLLKSVNYTVGVNTFRSNFNDLIKIVYELILNTHDWARTDENNKRLFPNTRGVYMRIFKAPPKSIQAQNKNFPSIQTFFAAPDFHLNSNGELYAIEISVFDSGPGLVNRFLGRNADDLTVSEQVKVIKKCLTRHTTSAKGQRSIVKGVGLDRVMSTLNTKGFLRIRTGSACVYRNMRTNPYAEVVQSEDIELFDWRTGLDSDYSDLPRANGTVVSLIYPMTIE